MRQSDDAENVDPQSAAASGAWPGLAAASSFQPAPAPSLAPSVRGGAPPPLKGSLPVAAAGAPAPGGGAAGTAQAQRRRPALRDITSLLVPQECAKDAANALWMHPAVAMGGGGGGSSNGAPAPASAPAAAAATSLLPPRPPPRAAIASMR
jgi:hypothetical protein